MRKTAFCICENKGADQLRGNRNFNSLAIFCPVLIGPGRKFRRHLFSFCGSFGDFRRAENINANHGISWFSESCQTVPGVKKLLARIGNIEAQDELGERDQKRHCDF